MATVVDGNIEQHFRQIYYHLYSNSNSARSERILSDLSKLIFASIAASKNLATKEIYGFIAGRVPSSALIEPLAELFPGAISIRDSFSLDDGSLRIALESLERINLKASPSHIFGDAFQALMGPRLRGDKGQFFTPRSLVRCLVEILSPPTGSAVIDPACGTGGFLAAVLERWRKGGISGRVVGVDKDYDLAGMASALSAVYDRPGDVRIHNLNSLDLNTLRSSGIKENSFDFVVTNPPFGSKIGISDRSTLAQFELGHVWQSSSESWRPTSSIRSSQDPQVLFLELCIRLLKDEGRMAIILPEGVYGNSSSGYIWDYVRSKGNIEGLIDCPRTTFQPGTDTKTNVLLFRRKAKLSKRDQTWIAVAYACGHDKRGRSTRVGGASGPRRFR